MEKETINMDNPLVSILIPCWGCKSYIGEAIRSALAQDYKPLEIIVVEDCGTDGTYEEAMKFSDQRLRVFRNEKNLGQFANKNRCLEFAGGEFVKYLDGDDVLEPNCVSVLVAAWQAYGKSMGLILARFSIINEHGKLLAIPHEWGVSGRCNGKRVLEAVIRMRQSGSRFGNPSSHLIKRNTLQQVGCFPNDHSWSGDWETFLKLLCATDVVFIPNVLARYRRQPQSVGHTRKAALAVEDNILMVERLTRFFACQQDIPRYLKDQKFIREWMVWASGNILMPAFFRKLRHLPNEYDSVRDVFKKHGLEKEVKLYICRRLVPYVFQTFTTKFRQRLHLPQQPPLFGPRFCRI